MPNIQQVQKQSAMVAQGHVKYAGLTYPLQHMQQRISHKKSNSDLAMK
jgi:hypothetical protein